MYNFVNIYEPGISLDHLIRSNALFHEKARCFRKMISDIESTNHPEGACNWFNCLIIERRSQPSRVHHSHLRSGHRLGWLQFLFLFFCSIWILHGTFSVRFPGCRVSRLIVAANILSSKFGNRIWIITETCLRQIIIGSACYWFCQTSQEQQRLSFLLVWKSGYFST